MRCRQARIDNNEDNEGRQVAALPPAVAREGDSHHSIASQPGATRRASLASGWSLLALAWPCSRSAAQACSASVFQATVCPLYYAGSHETAVSSNIYMILS